MKPAFYTGCLVLGLGLAWGATPIARAQAPDRVQEMNGIVFVSGGIGADSRDDLAAREKSYNFKLVLTLDVSGSFVSGARVTLSSAAGDKLVDHVTEGPIMLAGLPAGSYVLSASFRGITHTRKLQARAERLHTEYMRWPADPTQDVTLPPDMK
jgi:hypothetical protein